MTESLTATELSRALSDVLNRVRYRGDTFDVVRNGEVVARLVPVQHPRSTVEGLLSMLAGVPKCGPDFAEDLEAVQAAQPTLGSDPWDS